MPVVDAFGSTCVRIALRRCRRSMLFRPSWVAHKIQSVAIHDTAAHGEGDDGLQEPEGCGRNHATVDSDDRA